jgi:hypothetical protein
MSRSLTFIAKYMFFKFSKAEGNFLFEQRCKEIAIHTSKFLLHYTRNRCRKKEVGLIWLSFKNSISIT